ncbi:MAG: PEP-CTERM sorting domain-containing protein [Haliea sp.]|nr:PEP-CTERM sorting domain-containing protein [Haliea sp.]
MTQDTQTPLDQVATITAVPEPASILLVAIGLAGLAAGANLRGQLRFKNQALQ